MKILAVVLLSIVGTVKSYSNPSIARPSGRPLAVTQITGEESVAGKSREGVIVGRWVEVSVTLFFFISIVTTGQRKLKKHLLLADQVHEMEGTIEELARLNSVKDILLSMISHDLRAPLVSLQSLLELAANKKITPDEFDHLIVEINNHLIHVKGFVDNILYWAKENFSQIKPSTDKLVLDTLVKEAVRLLSFNAKKKQITIHADLSAELVISADAELVKLILRNLISNAIKFSKINDKVYIRAIDEDEMVRISVEDTGQGISEKNIATLFEISHLSANGTDDEIGVGLGLTLCKEFVEKMGGKISVLSKEGEGSRFEFTVPRFIKNEPSTEAT